MKISKLFHWLYAFVMFLPILAVGSTVLISTFNMSAKEESEIHYKYQTNEVNSNQDVIIGNLYHVDIEEHFLTYGSNGLYSLAFVNFSVLTDFYNVVDETYYESFNDGYTNTYLCILENGTLVVPYYDGSGDIYTAFIVEDERDFHIVGECIVLQYQDIESGGYFSFSKSDYNEIESVETNNVDSKEVFYESLDELKESPYFSWAYNSFLSTPIVYIVGLFSMPTNHVIVELLSYWLAISIIWLVFDLIMYVPLLVHRWLDKGVLE